MKNIIKRVFLKRVKTKHEPFHFKFFWIERDFDSASSVFIYAFNSLKFFYFLRSNSRLLIQS